MATDVKMTFDINELIKINSDVSEARYGIENNLAEIGAELDELQTNVTGTQVNNLISSISENIDGIYSKISQAMFELTDFLDGQVKNYTITYESALAIFKEALTFIDSNFSV